MASIRNVRFLAYALVFGFAQLLATRLIDARGISPLNELPDSERPVPGSLLGRRVSGEGPAQHLLAKVPEVVTDQVRTAILGPPLVNYDGWVSVAVRHEQAPVEPVEGRFTLDRGRGYEIVVTIGPAAAATLAERLVVTGGVDRSVVDFTVEIDSDRPDLRREPVPAPVGRAAAVDVVIALEVTTAASLWVRVAQGRRTLQSLSLLVDAA